MSSTFVAQKDIKRRQYIATQVFNSFFYVYSNYVDSNYNTRGTLAVHPQATALNCKAGKILRETGRKLITGQNPDLTIGNKSFTYLVGVFDSSSGLNGFIDPNSPSFAVFNSDKAPFLNVGTEVNDGETGLQDLGQPTFTRGPVLSLSGLGYPTGVGAGSFTTQGSGSGKGTAVTLSVPTGQITMDGAQLNAGTVANFTLTNTFLSASDMLVIQHVSGGTLGGYTVTASVTGASTAVIYVRNNTALNLSEAIVLKFVVIKSSTT